MISRLLQLLAKKYIKKYRPQIVGVVSNAEDIYTNRAVYCVLAEDFNLLNFREQNNQLDLLLNILNIKERPKSALNWFWLILKTKLKIILEDKNYPSILILDFSRIKFQEMNQLLKFLPIHFAVINKIGNSQGGLKETDFLEKIDKSSLSLEDSEKQKRIEYKKKNKILSILESDDWAILNIDGQEIVNLSKKTKAQIFSFSQKTEADIRALEVLQLEVADFQQKLNGEVSQGVGLNFKLIHKGSVVPIKLPKIFDQEKIPAVLAGISLGILKGLNMVKIAEKMEKLE